MWFFMILSYVMVAISGIGLFLIGMNHYFNIWAQNHIALDLLISIIFVATQTLVMFFFVGTGVNIREYVESHEDVTKDLYQQMLGLKRKLYPPTMMVTILFMALVIIDGVFFLGKILIVRAFKITGTLIQGVGYAAKKSWLGIKKLRSNKGEQL